MTGQENPVGGAAFISGWNRLLRGFFGQGNACWKDNCFHGRHDNLMSLSLSLDELEKSAALVYQHMGPALQYAWPLLAERGGCEVWVKHENHTPIGAFKIRGGLNYRQRLKEEQPCVSGVISAIRGNHGQSIGLAAKLTSMAATILVPRGNNMEKNKAMRALGADLIEYGDEFQEAAEHAQALAATKGLHVV